MGKCKDDLIDDESKEEQNDRRDKVLVPVRCQNRTDKEEISAEKGKDCKFEIPRSWYTY